MSATSGGPQGGRDREVQKWPEEASGWDDFKRWRQVNNDFKKNEYEIISHIFHRHGEGGKPNDPESIFHNKLSFQTQSELSVQIQLLGGWEKGDSKTWCSQLPKGPCTPLKHLSWKSFEILMKRVLFGTHSTRCPRRPSRPLKSQHSTSGTGNIMRSVDAAAQ